MKTFAKTQIASLVSSLADYWTTITAVELLRFLPVWGSAAGTVVGGLVNFSLGRRWVFGRREEERKVQLMRYALVWSGYLLLTTTGVYLLTTFAEINYVIAKLAVSLVMAISYNYPLQKHYVFRYQAYPKRKPRRF
jgi:putative flippase GtrA